MRLHHRKKFSIWLSALFLNGCAEMMKTQTQVTSPPGQSIAEAQAVPYTGTKKRVAVMRFENKSSAQGQVEIGSGMAEQLISGLVKTGRFIVLERLAVDDLIREQDLSLSGRVKPQTAQQIGEVEGAEFLVYGAVTSFKGDFKGGSVGAGVGQGAAIGAVGGFIGAAIGAIVGGALSYQEAHVAIDMRIVDARTGRIVNATTVEGTPPSAGGNVGAQVGTVAFGVSGFYNTPMGQAVRVCIETAVDWVIKNAFVNVPGTPAPQVTAPPKVVAPTAQPSKQARAGNKPIPSQAPSVVQKPASPAQGTEFYLVNGKFNLRDSPNGKIVGAADKDTLVAALGRTGQWVNVLLPDGKTGWIAANALKKLDGANPPISATAGAVGLSTSTTVSPGQWQSAPVTPVVAPALPNQQAQPIVTPQAAPASPSITVYAATDLTVIDKPFNGAVLGTVSKGNAVSYLEESLTWAKIRLASGQMGWVEKVFLSFAPPLSTAAQTSSGGQQPAETGVVKTSGSFAFVGDVKIREKPQGGIIAAADKGVQVAVLEENAGWSKVQLQNGEVGWVETANLLPGDLGKGQ